MIRRATIALACLVAAAAAAPVAEAAPRWHQVRVDPPPPPPGSSPAPFDVPLGFIGEISFWAPNRGLMMVEGNHIVREGIYHFDGERWKPYAAVCGGQAAHGRIAWAGPTEFWVTARVRHEIRGITESAPTDTRDGNRTLCRFRDGRVEQSFGTLRSDPNAWLPFSAAGCASPTDCWFAGGGFRGLRSGGFHLHWDGSTLEQVVGDQGRAISDLAFAGGRWYETTFLGDDWTGGEARLTFPESPPRPLHRMISGAFRLDPFVPRAMNQSGNAPSELHDMAVAGPTTWIVGGPAATDRANTSGQRTGPVLALLDNGVVSEVTLESGRFASDDSFFHVAPIPGTDEAWIAVSHYEERLPTFTLTRRGRLVRVDADGNVLESVTTPAAPAESQGPVLTVECPAPDDCWAATRAGWVWRWSEPGRTYARDTDPAFNVPLIEDRPNDGSVPQFTPDAPPIDDSMRFAPPPAPDPPQQPPRAAPRRRIPALVRDIRVRRQGRTTLVIRFRLARRAQISFLGKRRSRVVARTRRVTRRPGRHTLRMRVSPRRWPTRIDLRTRELRPRAG
jgi:hypothetical protein